MAKAYLVKVFGRVQGVGYRASVFREATKVGISGWVRNLSDGTVEAVLSFMKRGPVGAAVSRLEVEETEPQQLNGFSIASADNATRF